MALYQTELSQQIQRLQVGIEQQEGEKRFKLALESYDAGLGWYAAGSLTIPLHQLPLLEQALAEWREQDHAGKERAEGKVIPFPGLRVAPQR
ncbi:MAG: hypothetical protein U1G07_15740 [Verrucomicrobiota bacterium]